MSKPVVWIIDAEHWPRACLRAELIERGYEAVGFETVRDALAALAVRRAMAPRLVIIDLAAQEVDSRQLAELARGGRPIIGVAGSIELNQRATMEAPWSALLRRPVNLGTIANIVGMHLSPTSSSREVSAKKCDRST